MDDHVARILTMLEEGKISAMDAQTLIAALRDEASAGQSNAKPKRDPAPAAAGSADGAESGAKRSFEFGFGRRPGVRAGFDGGWRQVQDFVKQFDPDRIARDVRGSLERTEQSVNRAFRSMRFFYDNGDDRPENRSDQPTAVSVETLNFDYEPGLQVRVDNRLGGIEVEQSGDGVVVEVTRVTWARTEAEAEELAKLLVVEAIQPRGDAGTARLEVRVTAPGDWNTGTVDLRVKLPEPGSVDLMSTFGAISVRGVRSEVRVKAVSAPISVLDIKGPVSLDGISGSVTASSIQLPVHISSKSGSVHAQHCAEGCYLTTVSGDIAASELDGGPVEARSVSGSIALTAVGERSQVSISTDTVSGDIRVSAGDCRIDATTVSGSVDVQCRTTETVHCQAVSGSIGAIITNPFDGNLSAGSISGSVKLTLHPESSVRYMLGSQAGAVTSPADTSGQDSRSSTAKGTLGAGSGSVDLRSRSGSVTLNTSSQSS